MTKKKKHQPKSLFYFCQQKIQQFPKLEKILLQLDLVIDYEYNYQKYHKNLLLKRYSRKNLAYNTRKLVKESLDPSFSVQDLLVQTRKLIEEIEEKHTMPYHLSETKTIMKIIRSTNLFNDLYSLEWELVNLIY